jgi:hypothetical protein
MPDLTVYDKFRSLSDYMNAAEERRMQMELANAQMMKAQADMQNIGRGGNLPAAMQLANAHQKALAEGNIPLAQDIETFSKTMDRGFTQDAMGNVVMREGYAPSLQQKSFAMQQGHNISDLGIKPAIAGAEKTAQLNAERTGGISDKMLQAEKSNELLSMAEKLLPKATGSYAGAAYALGKKAVGVSDESTQANADLETLAGWLTSNVPRMQGPQSDKDTLMYAQMGAKVGDKTVPIQDRLSAVKTLRELNDKYTNPQPTVYDQEAARFKAGRQPSGGVLHVDKNGNKAMVFPDGHYEEVK